MRPGGAIAAHNAFRAGELLDPAKDDADLTQEIELLKRMLEE